MHSDKNANDASFEQDDETVCPHCGAPLPQDETPMRVAGPLPVAPAPAAGLPNCPNCGKPVSSDK